MRSNGLHAIGVIETWVYIIDTSIASYVNSLAHQSQSVPEIKVQFTVL